jgi:UDP-N-acetylmuramate dehydrogenase
MTTRTVLDRAAARLAILGERVRRNEPIGERTTYGVGGRAALFVEAATAADLAVVAETVRHTGLDVFVLGRGSNVLVSDDGFHGVCVGLDGFDTIDIDEDNHVVAGGSVLLPVLARTTVRRSLTGLEWAVGVPGTVGGGVRMNAGGHGSDMAATLVSVRLFSLATGTERTVSPDHLGLRFRGSDLTDTDVVVAATFALQPGDRAAGEAELGEIVRWRREHQPGGQNAGSVFVNPIPGVLSAGQVIDECGLRGHRLGTAEVSAKHANFIQADPNGRSADVVALMQLIQSTVLAQRGIALRSENRLLGFDVDHIGESVSS